MPTPGIPRLGDTPAFKLADELIAWLDGRAKTINEARAALHFAITHYQEVHSAQKENQHA